MAKPKKEVFKRTPFPWGRLKAMWDSNRTYTEIAKALDSHFNPEGDDPTKSIRAKISVAVNRGIRIDGKMTRFARRSKAPIGKSAKPTPVKTQKVTAKKAVDRKPAAAAKKVAPKATAKKSVPKKATVKKSATKKKVMPTVKVNEVANGPEVIPTPKQDETGLLPS